MKRLTYVAGLVCLGLIFITGGAGRAGAVEKVISITFDDLPVVRVHDRIQRLMITDEILYTLDEYDAPAAGFVVGDNIGADIDILESWLEAGHVLGNHTFSHPDLNEVPAELYIKDIDKGAEAIEDLLKRFKQKKRYYRYPSLHYGDRVSSKNDVAKHLSARKDIIAHVSVDTDDFVYNLQFERIYESGDSVGMARLGAEYREHIAERLAAAEHLADDLLGRPVKHILLLHANRLNAHYLSGILALLAEQGYTFISLDAALADPVYRLQESYIGSKGLSYLERLARSDPDLLPAREGR